jgi:hypothetical protein
MGETALGREVVDLIASRAGDLSSVVTAVPVSSLLPSCSEIDGRPPPRRIA